MLTFSTKLLPTTLSMMLSGMLGVFLVLGAIVLCVYTLNRLFSTP